MLNEIFNKVAKKHNRSPEEIKFIYKNFINSIRYYLDNPIFSKTTIRIPEFGSFKITEKSVRTFKDGSYIDYYNQFKTKKVYEGSKKRIKNNDVSNESRYESSFKTEEGSGK